MSFFVKNAYQFASAKCLQVLHCSVVLLPTDRFHSTLTVDSSVDRLVRIGRAGKRKKVVTGDSPGWLVEKYWVVGFSERGFMLDLFYPYARRLLYFIRILNQNDNTSCLPQHKSEDKSTVFRSWLLNDAGTLGLRFTGIGLDDKSLNGF